jgi:hypothetical protein
VAKHNPAVPADLTPKAQVELSAGVPFVSDADLMAALYKACVPPTTANAIAAENATARIDGLRASPSLLAVIGLLALFFTRCHRPTGRVTLRTTSPRRCDRLMVTASNRPS